MDELLCLFEKYSCHLNRGVLTSVELLHNAYTNYIHDLKSVIALNDNQLKENKIHRMICNEINDIEKNAMSLIKVLELYNEGKIVNASLTAFKVFENMKSHLMFRYSGATNNEEYYRIRAVNDNNPFPLERKELFHIPLKKNYLVGTERYSMPGHPCLYLASQPELCWYECGKPEKFAISSFDIPQDEGDYMKFIDFSEKLIPLKTSFKIWFNNTNDSDRVRKYLLKYICTYPLRAACSIVVEHPGCNFIEEYIIPQLLLQWVSNDDFFDGIRYESCSSLDVVKKLGGHNIVLVTKKFDTDGYDINLRKKLKVGEPVIFDINHININPKLKSLYNEDYIKEYPFLWGLSHIPNNRKKI